MFTEPTHLVRDARRAWLEILCREATRLMFFRRKIYNGICIKKIAELKIGTVKLSVIQNNCITLLSVIRAIVVHLSLYFITSKIRQFSLIAILTSIYD